MGLTSVLVALHGPKGSREISLVVDTGSEDTWIHERILREIGLEPRFSRTYRTINNALLRREVGPVEIEFMKLRMPCPTVFANEGDVNVLGATALEIHGLEIDPRTHELKHTEALAAF